jgi:hypothetical protein
LAALAILLGGLAMTASAAQAAPQELTIAITGIKAIDKADEFSKGDFYARVTIDGQVHATQPIKQQDVDKPDWKIIQKVEPGVHKVKLEILDKDISQDDPIDINRFDNKRSIEFEVNSKTCRVLGFSSGYKCGATITRAGKEKKAAEVSFKVSVKK